MVPLPCLNTCATILLSPQVNCDCSEVTYCEEAQTVHACTETAWRSFEITWRDAWQPQAAPPPAVPALSAIA